MGGGRDFLDDAGDDDNDGVGVASRFTAKAKTEMFQQDKTGRKVKSETESEHKNCNVLHDKIR